MSLRPRRRPSRARPSGDMACHSASSMLAIPAPGCAKSPPGDGLDGECVVGQKGRPSSDQVRRHRCLARTRRRDERECAAVESDRARMKERETLKRGGEGQHLSEQQALPAPGRNAWQGGIERRTVAGDDVSAVSRRIDPVAHAVSAFNAHHEAAVREPPVDDGFDARPTPLSLELGPPRPTYTVVRRLVGRPIHLGDARAPAVAPPTRYRMHVPASDHPARQHHVGGAARQPRAPSFSSSNPRSSSCEQRSQRSSSISCWPMPYSTARPAAASPMVGLRSIASSILAPVGFRP